MSSGGFRSIIGAPRGPEFRRLSVGDRFTLDLHYMTVKWAAIIMPTTYLLLRPFEPALNDYHPFMKKMLLPATRRFRCRPLTFIYGVLGLSFLGQHVYTCRMLSRDPRRIAVLKFIEEDNGLVSWLTMPFIPMEKRWSFGRSARQQVPLSKEFITEEQCQYEAKKAIFDPEMVYIEPIEGLAEVESAWERVRRENE